MYSTISYTKDPYSADLITHDGNFGPEEVFSILLVILCKDEITICRTNDVPEDDFQYGISMDRIFVNTKYDSHFALGLNYFPTLKDVWDCFGKSYFSQLGSSITKYMERDIINIAINYSQPDIQKVLIKNRTQFQTFNICEEISFAGFQDSDNDNFRYTDFTKSIQFLGEEIYKYVEKF